ncbi:MFS transporter [Spongiactinospora gelatinilytica]|uniref:MFS transporter n=1 Tax=Spongiactinospora gelatinilytica TaxID=2666298 RepID=A0A2W2F173_9ACTN|nr:MFS transporter [Spongiactinospora gelatinilytica]PZG29932.1 MFS transporter [Spongiactinospora gelatinilytica]
MNALSARRRYALVSALTWLPPGLMMAPLVLLMSGRGLGVAEIGAVMGLYGLVVVLLELPTGGLSDVIGRRTVLAASGAFSAAAYTVLVLAHSLPMFMLGSALKGVARALSSGPAQAWYVDTLHAAEGRDADLKPGLARGEAMGSIALCAGVVTGGLLPLGLSSAVAEPLAAPMMLAGVASVALLAVVLVALPEPPRERLGLAEVLRGVPLSIRTGVGVAVRDGVLARMLGVSAAAGIALCSIELLTPIRLGELAGGPDAGSTAYGTVAAVGFAASAAGHALAPALARVAGGSARGARAGAVVTALALGGLAASTALPGAAGLAATAGAYLVLFVGLSAATLLHVEIMHGRVEAAQRATLLSVDSLSLQFGGFLANIGLGWLAGRAGIGTAWAVASGLMLLSTLLYPRTRAVLAIAPRPAP